MDTFNRINRFGDTKTINGIEYIYNGTVWALSHNNDQVVFDIDYEQLKRDNSAYYESVSGPPEEPSVSDQVTQFIKVFQWDW